MTTYRSGRVASAPLDTNFFVFATSFVSIARVRLPIVEILSQVSEELRSQCRLQFVEREDDRAL
jgi:hypothetical protein